MNKAGKRLLIFMSFLFVFALSVGLAACGTNVAAYTVELEYDESMGTLTLDPVRDTFEANSTVTIIASAKAGYEIDAVRIDGEEITLKDGKYVLTVTKDTKVSASFYPEGGYKVTLADYDDTKGSASLEPAQERYLPGTSVTIKVTPIDGYVIDTVMVDGTSVSVKDGKYTFTVTKDVTVSVTFREESKYTVTTEFDKEKGDVTLDPAQENYRPNTSVTITVTANEGFAVDSVKVDGITVRLKDGKYTFKVTKNLKVVVTFKDAPESNA